MSGAGRPSLFGASKAGAVGKKRKPNFRPTAATSRPNKHSATTAKPAIQQQQPSAPPPPQEDTIQHVDSDEIIPPGAIQKATSLAEEPELPKETIDHQPVEDEQIVQEQHQEQEATSPSKNDAATESPPASAKKARKRNTIVPPSRPPPLEQEAPALQLNAAAANAATTETAHAAAPPVVDAAAATAAILQAADPGKPTMAAFCSKFRSKRSKADREAAAAEKAKQTSAALALDTANVAAAQTEAPTAPQVQVINGEIVLNESSIIVAGTTAAGGGKQGDTDDYTVVEEEAQMAVVGASYNSFVPRRKPQHWTVDETKLFYDALRQVGTDFDTMEFYFAKRTRKQLKRKFQMESTKNPHLIDKALNVESRKEIDMSVFNVNGNEKAAVSPPSTANETVATQQPDENDLHSAMLGVSKDVPLEVHEIVKFTPKTTAASKWEEPTNQEAHLEEDPLLLSPDETVQQAAVPLKAKAPKSLNAAKPKFKARPRVLPRRK